MSKPERRLGTSSSILNWTWSLFYKFQKIRAVRVLSEPGIPFCIKNASVSIGLFIRLTYFIFFGITLFYVSILLPLAIKVFHIDISIKASRIRKERLYFMEVMWDILFSKNFLALKSFNSYCIFNSLFSLNGIGQYDHRWLTAWDWVACDKMKLIMSLTGPWDTCVCSKNIFANTDDCNRWTFAVTVWMEGIRRPAIYSCLVTAIPLRRLTSHRL